MRFTLLGAMAIAAATVICLLIAAGRNRRAGWTRQRGDDFTDLLMNWMAARQYDSPGAAAVPGNPAPGPAGATAAPLLALHSAVGANRSAPVTPSPGGSPQFPGRAKRAVSGR